MAEHTEADLEERAWAMAQARAFLAPREPAAADTGPRPAAVVAVVIVPVPALPEARGDETVRRRGDEEQEGSDDG